MLLLLIVISTYGPDQTIAAANKALNAKRETVLVFPSSVTADNWSNLGTLSSQDLDDFALQQEFNTNNSAYLSVLETDNQDTSATPVVEATTPQSESIPESVVNEPQDNSVPIPLQTEAETQEPASEPVPATPVPEAELEPVESEAEPEAEVEPAPADEPLSWFAPASGFFKLLQAEVTEPVAATEVVEPPSAPTAGSETPVETVPEEVPVTPTESATATETQLPELEVVPEDIPNEDVIEEFVEEPVVENTVANSISLTGFDIPKLASGQFIDNLQLRLSLGGEYSAELQSEFSSGALSVEYSFGEFTKNAGGIFIEEQSSNAFNGGYYLVSLPSINDAKLLKDLKINISFKGDIQKLESLFIDAAWLELNTVVYDKQLLKDRIAPDKLKHLAGFETMKFLSDELDFTREENPNFSFKYESQRNLLVRTFRGLFSSTFAEVDHVTFLHPGEGAIGITPSVTMTEDGLVSVVLSDADKAKLRPGVYKVEVAIAEGGVVTTDTFEFQWGLLSINTNQTAYTNDDTVKVYMGSLSPNGNTVCNANLNLFITDPTGYISNTAVVPSGQCDGNNVVDVPDYSTEFVVNEFGEYELYLERTNEFGEVIAHTNQTFTVVQEQKITIERSGPTRIFPPAPYAMELTVHALDGSFSGELVEQVPSSFTVTNTDATVRRRDGMTELVWDMSIRNGESQSVSYEFDAPDLSPFLFELGPARLQTEVVRTLAEPEPTVVDELDVATPAVPEIPEEPVEPAPVEESAPSSTVSWLQPVRGLFKLLQAEVTEPVAEPAIETEVAATTEPEAEPATEPEEPAESDPAAVEPVQESITETAQVVFEEGHTWQIASDATGNMVLFWDGAGAIPAGWTCLSCGSGTFFQKFIMGGATYNTVGGATTHTHTAAGAIATAGSSVIDNSQANDVAPNNHTHTFTPVINAVSNLPAYRQLRVIQYTDGAGEPLVIPAGAIGVFDATVPTGWTRYAAQDGRYIYGENTPTTLGGSNTHVHTITGTTGGAVGTAARNRNGGTQLDAALIGHTHTVNGSTVSISNEPPFINAILGKINANGSAPNGLIAMWTDEVPADWLDVSTAGAAPFNGRFIKPAATYGATGGASTHTHANVTGITTSAESTSDPARSGTGGSGTHTHAASATGFNTVNNLPPYLTVIFGKRANFNPQYVQLSYRWYTNVNSLTPTDPWPAGATNLTEREPITATSTTVKSGDVLRLRMNTTVSNFAAAAGTKFKLQYGAGAVCSDVVTWTNVGTATSSEIWRGFNNLTPADHATIPSRLLTDSDVSETYQENGYATGTPNAIPTGNEGEWDFVLQQNNAAAGTNYCFRMVKDNESPFLGYTSYPKLLTNASPGTTTLAVPFNYEASPSLTPTFTFSAADPDGESLQYELQLDDTFDFSSPVLSASSTNYPTDAGWSATTFASGASVNYVVQPANALTNGQTYWLRVRSKDPTGSNWWSPYRVVSFTVNTDLAERGWLQTKGRQFTGGTFSSSTGTTTDAVVLTSFSGTVSTTTDSFEGVANGSAVFTSTNLWKQAVITTDSGDWFGTSGGTGSGGTGPNNATDGTTAIYAEASNGQPCNNTVGGTTCAIEADIVDGTLEGITFDYHMYGANIPTLNLDVYDGSTWTTVWTRTGQQSVNETDWKSSGYLNLSTYRASTTALRFNYVGNAAGFAADVALDFIRVATSSAAIGTLMSPEIAFNSLPGQSSWGDVEWSTTEPAGTYTKLRVYHSNVSQCDTIIPDGDLPGNSAGFNVGANPLFINTISTTTYDQICLQATLGLNTGVTSPSLNDWAVNWVVPNQAPQTPWLSDTPSFDNYYATTTPVLGGFTTTDFENDVMEYQIVLDDNFDFSSPVFTKDSANYPTDAGWTAATFPANATTTYNIQAGNALTSGVTYWWKVRARDPLGTNTWGEYTQIRSVTIDDSLNQNAWHQTVGYQFERGTLNELSTSSLNVQLTTIGGSGTATTTDSFEGVANTSAVFTSTNLWKQATITTDDGDWFGTTGGTGSGGTGPSNATDGTRAIFTEASAGQPCANTALPGNDCVIEADIEDGTIDGIEFDYHMFGGSFGTLNLDVYDGATWTTVWTRTGQQSANETDWQSSGYIDLTAYKDSTQALRFFADGSGAGFDADFALDFIRVGTSSAQRGTIKSAPIDFDWMPSDTTWGTVEWNVTEPAGSDSKMRVYYTNVTQCDTLIPDGDLPGNSTGYDADDNQKIVDTLSGVTYNEICLEMTLSQGGAASSPTLDDWTVRWDVPDQSPFAPDLAETPAFEFYKSTTTTPVLGGFAALDYELDSMGYEIQVDDSFDFSSPVIISSSEDYPSDAGWAAASFAANATTTYTVQPGEELTNGQTYWWRVRAKDPTGTNQYGDYSESRSFTVSTAVSVPEWFQTTDEQFKQNTNFNSATTTGDGGVSVITTGVSVTELNGWSAGTTKTITEGSNRLLLVTIVSEDGGVNSDINTVTYGGQTLTQIEDQQIGTGFSNGAWIGYLNEAGIAAAVDTTITPNWVGGTPSNGVFVASASYRNVNQVNPVRDSSPNALTSGTNITPTAAIDALAGDMMVYVSETAQGITHTPATGYTEGIEQEVVISGDEFTAAVAYKPILTDSSEYPEAVWSAAGNRLLMIALALQPSTNQGSFMSREIDFDWVDNQIDWGEISWNVNEPAGSQSLLRVYYSTVGSCDTIIPDGALPGNAAGYIAGGSPVDISSLNTTTYNRICLQMTLSKGTAAVAPVLTDWTVSWELSSVYEQSGYQWYNNTDSLTPTDTWPAGATAFELIENQPINQNFSTKTGDVLRLRMGVGVSSVAATGKAFKLQYAAGLSCSSGLEWFDVSPASSSTALWRGFSNPSLTDGATLPSTLLSASDVAQTYEEANNTAVIPNDIGIGEYAEWDWVLENKAKAGTNYCFRMVATDGKRFKTYTNYPSLITNKAPTIEAINTPFDNEKFADQTPDFEFTGVDFEGDSVDYQIQIDNDADFSSTVADHNSAVNFTYFKNLVTISDKSPFEESESIRYTIPTTLSNNTTYWWRVRSTDTASKNYGEWSTPRSFTIDTSTSISTWYQTTQAQFATNMQESTTATAAGGGAIELESGQSVGTTTSSAIDFDDVTIGNSWGAFTFNETGAANDILYRIEFFNGTGWTLIPDGDLAGNSAGYDNSPVDLIDLDTETYNQLRIRANFNNGAPSVTDWTVTWGLRVSVPTHLSLFDNEKTDISAPTLTFLSTDPESDDLEYQLAYSTDSTFGAGVTTVNSNVDAGFVNLDNGADTSPYTSGDTISYTVQSPLVENNTYWWRVRAKDPAGGDSYSFWSEPWSFTISSTATTSTWFQTTDEQFATDDLTQVQTTGAGGVSTVPAAVTTYTFAGVTGPSAVSVARDFQVNVTNPTDPSANDSIDTLTISGTPAGAPNLRSGIAGYASDAEATTAQYSQISASDDVRWTITNPGGANEAVFWTEFAIDELPANIAQIDVTVEGYQGGAGTDPAWLGIWRPGTTTPYWEELDHFVQTGTDGTFSGTITANFAEYFDGNNNLHVVLFNETPADSLFIDYAEVMITTNTADSGVVTGTSLDFDDGSGPAWGQYYWSDTLPGASSISYQIEYLNGAGSWALIPNSALPGNESGFTSDPVDLKFLNTTTYNQIRPVANLSCASGNCPTLNDWSIEWSRGFNVSGTAFEYDGVTAVTSGTVAVAVNGELQIGKTAAISAGAWSIDNVTYFPGDIITVFVSGAVDADEAVAVTKYDGTPDVTGMRLQKRHLSLGSDDSASISNANIGLYDSVDDEDVFFTVSAGNDLTLCGDVACDDASLYIVANNTYAPAAGADLVGHDFINNGTVTLSNNTWKLSGSYDNNATTTFGASTVVMTAVSGTETIDSTGATAASLNNLTLGETSGSATWNLQSELDINGNLLVTHGTLNRQSQPISIARTLTTAVNGFWAGMGTTTFDGINPTNASDNNPVDQNIGRVVVDGTSKTLILGTSALIESMYIAGNDNFDLNNQTLVVNQSWLNTNTFTPRSGTVVFAATTAGQTITNNGAGFFNLTFNGTGGAWSFTEPSLTVGGNVTISAGVVTLPTATTTVAGSFNATGGTFAHNNGTLAFTANSAKTITFAGGAFSNTTYNLLFNGAGSWTMTDVNATSSNNVRVQQGTATLPSGVLAVGGNFTNTAAFVHNAGTVLFYANDAGNTVNPGSSAFGDLTFNGVGGDWSLPTSADVNVANDFTVSNGTVYSTTGTLAVGGSWLVEGSAPSPSGNPGDYVIRRNGSATSDVTTSDLDATWDTAVNKKGTAVSYSGGEFTMSAGKYLVLYSERFDTNDITNNQRVEIQSRLVINGVATTTGAGQTFIRKEDGTAGDWQRAGIVGGSAILDVADDGTSLATRFFRTDSASDAGGTTFRTPNWGGVTVLRLDDAWDFARYSLVGETAAVGGFAEVPWDQTNEEESGFTRSGANITLSDAGRYLVSYTIPITTDGGTTRTEYVSKLQLDNTDVEGTYVSTYMRENESTDDGVLSYVGVIDAGAGQVLDVKLNNSSGDLASNFMEAGSSLEIVKLPAGSETIIVEATSGEMNPATVTEFAWDTTAHIDTAAFTMTNPTDSYLEVDIADDYLFFATQQTTGGGVRTFPSARFSVEDTVSQYAAAGQYSRGAGGADQAGYAFGSLLTNVSPGNDISLVNLFIEVDQAGQNVNHAAMSGIRLGSLFAAGSAAYESNTGLVLFNSTDTGETIAAGPSEFYDVEIANAAGGWSVIDNLYASNDFVISAATDFTVGGGVTLTVDNAFTNRVGGAATTWSGSTLALTSGDYDINLKSDAGDSYDTLAISGGAQVGVWNSSATTYAVHSLGSLYSKDHSGINGDLNIYGRYQNTAGVDYWSYATDFDGTDLSGGAERLATVRFASGASARFTNASLQILGSAVASTTISNQGTGTYTVNVSGGTTSAQYYDFSDLGLSGVSLTGAANVPLLRDGRYEVASDAGTALTLSSTTIDANPSKQIFNVTFATSSAITATNVTQTDGVPVSYWWFRDSAGNLDGEALDNDTGDPGSIRWDDSSLTITVSGTVFSDAGVTPITGGTCDDTTPVVRAVIEGGASYIGTCSSVDGSYSIPGVVVVGDPTLTVYLDGASGGERATVVTKTPTADISNLDLYTNRVIVRNEDISALTIANLAAYDSASDSDVQFTASTSTVPANVQVNPGTELFVFASSTFAPGGDVVLLSNSDGTGYEGTLYIDDNASFIGSGTSTYTIGGRMVLDAGATFTPASSTVVFTATTTGKSITAPSEVSFFDIVFNGSGGGWNLGADILVVGDMSLLAGTVTGTQDISVPTGSITGNGVLSLGAGTTTIGGTNTLGGASVWTFFNLTLGDGISVGTTTPVFSGVATVAGQLVINPAHFFNAANTTWNLSGSGTVFVENGTFVAGTSRVRYSGPGANVLATDYYNLDLNATAGPQTYVATGLGIIVDNDLAIGGASGSVFDINTNDTVLDVNGDVSVLANGTLTTSGTADFTIAGNYTNLGVLNANAGLITFDGAGSSNIAAGAGVFGSVLVDSAGSVTVSQSATTTGDWTLAAASDFTLASGQTLAVGNIFFNNTGGAATTWTGSTLSLYGNNTFSINATSTSDTYETLAVRGTTQARLWNSDAATYSVDATASLYSQDHAAVDGDLYIWGAYKKTGANDYWSYATDFDGRSLTGVERKVDVFFGSNASAEYSAGSLSVRGGTSASTTIQSQGGTPYNLTVTGTASTTMRYYEVRDIASAGLQLFGSAVVSDLSYGDLEVSQTGGSAITVHGSVITANPAKTFTGNRFELNGVGSGFNVTALATTVSSWRFTNHYGGLAGEANDSDPDGDPGYIVWDNSAANITISGTVFTDEGVTAAGAGICNGALNAVRLVVAGITTYDTSCANGTGVYSVSGVSFSPGDSIIAYLLPATGEEGATVTVDPSSNINNFDIYWNRLIVRHEGTNPITIADLAVYDSSDAGVIPFTAVNAGTDTLTLPADRKLIVWTGKEFAPGGNVTVSAGGTETYGGSVSLFNAAKWTGVATEQLSVGGNFLSDTGAQFTAAPNGTTTFTTSGTARTIDVNGGAFANVAFTGSGSWSLTDSVFTVNKQYTKTAGALTFPTGTSTFAGSFVNTGGSFVINGSNARFVGVGANTITLGGSNLASAEFAGGTYVFGDTNATTTASTTITSGSVTLPSGILSVGGDFTNNSVVIHNTSDIYLTNPVAASIQASSSDLFGVNFVGGGAYVFIDESLTLRDSLLVSSGSVTLASGTLAVGGDFIATGGTFASASGTVLLNSADAGEFINPGTSTFHNLQISAPTGGYTLSGSATTTNNFALISAASFVAQPATVLAVKGVFLNSVANANTTWTGSTLVLDGANAYTINTKTVGDRYENLVIGDNSDIRMWNSTATSTTVAQTSSLYSQDHAGVNGELNIYGDFHVSTSTEYWSYATDFDGASLAGVERDVTVHIAGAASTTVDGGSLQMIGATGHKTTVTNQGAGQYALGVTAGSLNASYYVLRNMNSLGLNISGAPIINSLAFGDYELALDGGSLLSLTAQALNANASLVIPGNSFSTSTPISGFNVNLTGVTANAWTYTAHTGNLDGENYDVDGVTECGSIRWTDSACLLTQQTQYRWRNDDGGLGVPDSEWYNTNWNARKQVRVQNADATSYSNAAVKMLVEYDIDMQADFDDLRFTSVDGVTELSFWMASSTNSSQAEVWLQVPSLGADDLTTVFMYFGNPTATSSSSAEDTFIAADDFEDGNISEYSGQTGLFSANTTFAYDGSYGLDNNGNENGRANLGGIYRLDQTVSQGETFRYLQYVDTTAGSGDETCTLFGVQSPGTASLNYAVCLEQFGTDRVSLVKNAVDNDASGTILASSTITYTTGWYEVEVDWGTDDSLAVVVKNTTGAVAATLAATDSTYTSGGIGFTYWFHNGAWDAVSSRLTLTTEPAVLFGAKQADGGATWKTAQNTPAIYNIADIARLRIGVENSGLAITNQQFLLEYAELGVAPSCEAISPATFVPVPPQATCGSSPICMQSTTYFTNNESTTDLLIGMKGQYTLGEAIESPLNKTNNLDINQNNYTEIEYAITPTASVTDENLCFRVTDNGSDLDTYLRIAQLQLRFDPVITNISLNGGFDISLIPGTTTPVYATGTVTDLNGFADITLASSTIYRSGVAGGALCTPDNNNCYTAASSSCSFLSCSGNSCDVQCKVDMFFHADPTDSGSAFDGQEWLALIEVEDTAGGYDFGSSLMPGIEVTTLRAIDVIGAIDYGALAVNSDTGSVNASTSVLNQGNVEVNLEVTGTDLTDGLSSFIPANQQKFSTSTFNYSGCGVSCDLLSSSTPVELDVDLSKPSVDTPPVADEVFWGIAIPFGVNSVPHQGINVFTPISP